MRKVMGPVRLGLLGLTLALGLLLGLATPQIALAAPGDDTPAVESSARIHVLSFGNTDAILLESDGRFGLVDAGEDDDYPSGLDPRYPLREGITRGQGVTDRLITYMKAMGVTQDNLEFFVGTHPHSDHIGGADEIIEEFKPARVYLMPYKDAFVYNSDRLWDNQYVYDRAVAAALANGATLIQGFDTSAPVDPARADAADPTDPADPGTSGGSGSTDDDGLAGRGESGAGDASANAVTAAQEHPGLADGSLEVPVAGEPIVLDAAGTVEPLASAGAPATSQDEPSGSAVISPAPEGARGSYVGNPNFKLGSTDISILNYGTDYFTTPKYDANEFSLGVLVEANGHRAFLAGDIDNLDGDEDRLAGELGQVDLLKIGHHGHEGSNTLGYLDALAPRTLIMTSLLGQYLPSQSVFDYLKGHEDARLIDTVHQAQLDRAATVADLLGPEITYNVPETQEVRYVWRASSPHYVRFEDGHLKNTIGWHHASWGDWYRFDNSPYALEHTWHRSGGQFYYFDDEAAMAKDGVSVIDHQKFLFDSNGHLVRASAGWFKRDGAWYFGEGGGTVRTGWLADKGSWYYLDPSTGATATGWAHVDGTWYHFNSSGVMQTGWLRLGVTWYYLQPSGAMATGWLKLGGTWYYLHPSGAMATGWLLLNGSWYYLTPGSGAMVTGSHTIDGEPCVFNGSGVWVA